MMERRKSKENIGTIMKTWLREKPWMSKGFYMWVTSEFHTWVTSVSDTREVWFPQWEGSSRVAGGDSPAAVTSPDTGCPEGPPSSTQPVPPSSTPGRAVRVRGVFLRGRNTRHPPSQKGDKGAEEKGLSIRRQKQVSFLHVSALAGFI